MATLRHEQFRTLFLDREEDLVVDERSWYGAATEVQVPVGEIVRHAILHGSDSLLFAHNHPAGDPFPSMQDVELTRKLVKICRELDIQVLDHIIVSCNGSFSFRRSGYM